MPEPVLEELVDVASLQRFVDETVPGPPSPLVVAKHVAGFSNETFYVTRGEERWVMRRPPRGPLLPTAHDVLREYRFISALHGKARVPQPVVACDDVAVIGAPFYLMERKEGVVIRAEVPAAYDNLDGRRRIGEELVEALVELHAVDWRAAGLEGRSEGYLERQLKRWTSQWHLTRPRTRDLPKLDEVTTWLEAHLPSADESPASTVVHGDYKLDNVMFDSREPKLIAIFDWEMATIGDPLADLGWLLSVWGGEGNTTPPPGFKAEALPPPVTSLPGFLTQEEVAALYEAKSGRSMRNFTFYRVMAVYKMAIILEGLYMHYVENTAANPGAAEFEWRVPNLVERMHQLIGDT